MAPKTAKGKAGPKPGTTFSAFVDGRKGADNVALPLVALRDAYGLAAAFKARCPTALVGTDRDGDEGAASPEPPRKRAKLAHWDGKSPPCDCAPGSITCLNRLGHQAWERSDGGASG